MKTDFPATPRHGKDQTTQFFNGQPRKALRAGNLKALSQDDGKTWQLYDLARDKSETNDLSSKRGKKLDSMKERFLRWEKSLMPQQWGWNPKLGYKDPEFGKPRPYHQPGYFEEDKP